MNLPAESETTPSQPEVKLTKRERKRAKNREKLKKLNEGKKERKLLKKKSIKEDNFIRNVKKLYEALIQEDFEFIGRAHPNHPRPAFDENNERIYYDEEDGSDIVKSYLTENDKNSKERWEREAGKNVTSRAKSHEELKARYDAKMEEFRKQKEGGKGDEKKRLRKKEKKIEKKAEKIAQGKELKKARKLKTMNMLNVDDVKEEDEAEIKQDIQERMPLKKKSVVKENGDLVYSKFDFLSSNGSDDTFNPPKRKKQPTDLLKSAEKHESKIARLEEEGKVVEAVKESENKKWTNALKRSKGEKVRDDPFLIKKTIKKQDKIKKASQKKWKERTELVNKQKQQREDKRRENIKGKRDEKVKKKKKILRKQGRIA